MASIEDQLNQHFEKDSNGGLAPDVLGELQSILRIHSMSPEELWYNWESYLIKRDDFGLKLNMESVRSFKQDIQEKLERQVKDKARSRETERKTVQSTPRNDVNKDDIFAMLDTVTPRSAGANGTTKRKAAFETPSQSKSAKSDAKSSPTGARASDSNGITPVPFNERQNAGQITETLNGHLEPCEPPIAPPAESRVKLVANTDLKKFHYKPLAMHLSEASEVLDDRIDEFTELVKTHHKLEDSAFGNAAMKSTNEIIAVGRIACEDPEGKLKAESVVFETSRRTGNGMRVPLKFEGVSCELFPGQIIAARGTNASDEYFTVKELLEIPILPLQGSPPSRIDETATRIGLDHPSATPTSTHTLNIMIAAGPYTTDDNLDFEPLQALCSKAADTCADALILSGPFLDTEHPLVASGDFELPADAPVSPDRATLSDAFRWLVIEPLRRLAQAVPSITIVLIPAARDAANKHAAWPQEPFPRRELGLPKQVKAVTNPVTLSVNEITMGISAQDVLWDLRGQELVLGKPAESNPLARFPKHLITQRHFFPLFPPADRAKGAKTANGEAPTGTPLDVGYLKLGEWLNVLPDVLVLPSALTPFAKVVNSVLAINPGYLSKKRGPGTYAQVSLHPRKLSDSERNEAVVGHKVYERARVDIVRI